MGSFNRLRCFPSPSQKLLPDYPAIRVGSPLIAAGPKMSPLLPRKKGAISCSNIVRVYFCPLRNYRLNNNTGWSSQSIGRLPQSDPPTQWEDVTARGLFRTEAVSTQRAIPFPTVPPKNAKTNPNSSACLTSPLFNIRIRSLVVPARNSSGTGPLHFKMRVWLDSSTTWTRYASR